MAAPQQVPSVGALAPDFTLRSSAKQDVTLSSFRGQSNVLLAFFPLAFTRTCTSEMCAFTDDFRQFASNDTVVLPISVDSDATLREYQAKYQMPFDLLSDFRREVSRAYGVLDEAKFYAKRAYVVIDRQGIVRWTWVEHDDGQRRENAELLDQLAMLRQD